MKKLIARFNHGDQSWSTWTSSRRVMKPSDMPDGVSRRELAKVLDYVRQNPGKLKVNGLPKNVQLSDWFKRNRERYSDRTRYANGVCMLDFCEEIDGAYYMTALYQDGKYLSLDGKRSFTDGRHKELTVAERKRRRVEQVENRGNSGKKKD